MVITYYIKLFRMGIDIHNGILISLLLVAETKSIIALCSFDFTTYTNTSKTPNEICLAKYTKTLKCPKENLDIASIPQYRPPSYITRKLGCNNKS